MFGLFRSDPVKKLDKQYQAILQEAMEAQRSGDIRRYSELTKQSELILDQIENLSKIKAP